MIAHIDMDAFFARCEELRNPELEDKPTVICVYTRGRTSGAVSTSNYRARELGISSGMPLSEARSRATEETVFLPVDHKYYRRKSEEVMSEVRSFSRKVQQTSVDEAYFLLEGDLEAKAKKIKARIESKGLKSSIGIGPNKFIAKLASEDDKPDGLRVVQENEVEDFIRDKEIGTLHGVGSSTEKKLRSIGVETVEDLRDVDNTWLVQKFGKTKASSLKAKSRGKGSTDLSTGDRKQMSKIKTMERNSSNKRYIKKELSGLADKLAERMREEEKAFQKVKIVVIDSGLESYTRSKKVKTSDSKERLLEEGYSLLGDLLEGKEVEVRRVGLGISGLVDKKKQMTLEKF